MYSIPDFFFGELFLDYYKENNYAANVSESSVF